MRKMPVEAGTQSMDFLDFIKSRIEPFQGKTEGERLDKKAFDATGAFIIRNALPVEDLRSWRKDWDAFYSEVSATREINKFNPVDFLAEVPDHLKRLYRNDSVVDHIKPLLGKNIGLFGSKLLIKDARSSGPVFLHQDYAYQQGSPNKVIAFLALNNTTRESGIVRFYLGTHYFGYLGDTGQIRSDILPQNWPVIHADLNPGDMVLMNCMLWHDSPDNRSGKPRIVMAATYQDADDFGTTELISGQRSWQPPAAPCLETDSGMFSRSRVSRLIELEDELRTLKERL